MGWMGSMSSPDSNCSTTTTLLRYWMYVTSCELGSGDIRYIYLQSFARAIHTDVVGFQGLLPGLWKINAHKILLNDLTTVICSVKLSNFLTPSKFDHLIRVLDNEFRTGELPLKKSQKRKFAQIQGSVLKISLLELKTSTTTLWANQPHIGGKANLSGFFVTHVGICSQYIIFTCTGCNEQHPKRFFSKHQRFNNLHGHVDAWCYWAVWWGSHPTIVLQVR